MYLERFMSLFYIPATAALMKSLGITDQFLVARLVDFDITITFLVSQNNGI